MTMLSGHRSVSARAVPATVLPACTRSARGVGFSLAGTAVEALPEGALWIDAVKTLVVSDLHLEKGSSFALRGRPIPPYDTRVTLGRLAALIGTHRPRRVVSLGDSFHDLGGPRRMAVDDRGLLSQLVSGVEWIWIEGNHDPEVPAYLGGVARTEVSVAGLLLRHEPTEGPAGEAEVAGHLHPCARVAGRGRSLRCGVLRPTAPGW